MEQKNDLDFILKNLLAGGKCILLNNLFKVSFVTNNSSMTTNLTIKSDFVFYILYGCT